MPRKSRKPAQPAPFTLAQLGALEQHAVRAVRQAAQQPLPGAERHEWATQQLIRVLDDLLDFTGLGEAASDVVIRILAPLAVRQAYSLAKRAGKL